MSAANIQHANAPTAIAIVGMAGRFPGAADVEALWQLLVAERHAVGAVPPDRWNACMPLDAIVRLPDVGGFIDDIAQFDTAFFDMSADEAAELAPHARLLLELSFRALEDAGIGPETLAGSRTGVYVAGSSRDHAALRRTRALPLTQHSWDGAAPHALSTRISRHYELEGPSLTLAGGGASSLVALHLACRALAAGEIDAAFVGAAHLLLAPDESIALAHAGALSRSGRCAAFSASADGYVRGEGVVALYLKPLSCALDAGDRIRAVIVRSAVAHAAEHGDEAAAARAHEALLRDVYAELPRARVAYVEAHGDGGAASDASECHALGRALAAERDAALGPLAIGSIKTNLGHLEEAAGLASVIKAVLSLAHREVPPSLHADPPRGDPSLDALNLQVARAPIALPASGDVYVGVSARGAAGSHAHVVLCSAPVPAPARASCEGPWVVALSAREPAALTAQARALSLALSACDAPLAEIAGTLAHRRGRFETRAAFVVDDLLDLKRQLATFGLGRDLHAITGRARSPGPVAFVFPGTSAARSGMGMHLFGQSARFRGVIQRCAAALAPHVRWDLEAVVSGAAGDGWLGALDVLQPTLWAVSVGLAELWREAGVVPDLVVGHGVGEIAAATVAGVLDLHAAAQLVARRGLLAQHAEHAALLTVELGADDACAAAEHDGRLTLASHDGPRACALTGPVEALDGLQDLLEAEGVRCRRQRADIALHGRGRDAREAALQDALAGIAPGPGAARMISSVDGCLRAGAAFDAGYWARGLHAPVRFAQAIAAAFEEGVTHVVEIAPRAQLAGAIAQTAARRDSLPRVLGAMNDGEGKPRDLARAFAQAFVAGLAPLATLPRDALVKLPGYALQRTAVCTALPAPTSRVGLEVVLAPTAASAGTWEGTRALRPSSLPWLHDDRVRDAQLVPAGALLSCMLTTTRDHFGTAKVLRDVRFDAPLVLTDEALTLSVVLRDDWPAGGSLRLSSRGADARAWTPHVSARAEPREAGALPGFPAQLHAQPARDPAVLHEALRERQLVSGPALDSLRALWSDAREALGELVLPEVCHATVRPDLPHPVLLATSMHVALALHAREGTLLPSAIARVLPGEPIEQPMKQAWVHVVRRDESLLDLTLYDAARRPVLHFEQLAFAATRAGARARWHPERVHRLRFVPAPLRTGYVESEHWLVCGTREDGAEQVAAGLRALGNDVGRAVPRASTLSGWHERLRTGSAPIHGVVYLAPREASLAEHRAALCSLAALVAACSKLRAPPRLAIVTTQAQATSDADVVLPDGALYWGFARVLRREHAELCARVIDRGTDAASIAACATELAARDGDDQVALRGDRRFAGRLVRCSDPIRPTTTTPAWRLPAQPFRLSATGPDGGSTLALRALSRRSPGAHEIEIAVSAAAASFHDVEALRAPVRTDAGQTLLGDACAGRVIALGAEVTHLKLGDRVVACVPGSLASHVTLAAAHAQKTPDTLSDAQAAALPLSLMAGWHALHELAHLARGEWVLVHGASGGLGCVAIALAHRLGAHVIATAGSPLKRARLQALGVAHVFDSRTLDWANDVRRVTADRGVDVVLNTLAGAALRLGLEVLAEDGRFIDLSRRDMDQSHHLALGALGKDVTFAAFDLLRMRARRPERFGRLLADAWGEVHAGRIPPMPVHTRPLAEACDALRGLVDATHEGKLVLIEPASVQNVAPAAVEAGRLRGDATYVISGGLGALGLSLVEFMAERDARSFLLLGRSAPEAATCARIDALRASGVQVEIVGVDVADLSALSRALGLARARMPPVRGVIHAAGVLDDSTILNLNEAQLARVLAPKVEGARNLDALTAADPLDLFVLFSSAAALLGHAGQAAYAAANAYLDALAEARRRRGLPALSIAWGPFDALGLSAEDCYRAARLAARGVGSIPSDEGFRAMLAFLEADETAVAYFPLALRTWFAAHPDAASQKSWQLLQKSADVEPHPAEVPPEPAPRPRSC